MDGVTYLTIDQVKELHVRTLEFGGLDGVRSEQLLASAVFQAQQSAFGVDAYPSVPEKAAAYGFFLTENHPFIDANKRTAAAAMEVFLEVNGYEFIATDDDAAQMFEDLAAGIVDQGEFFGWVANHSRRRPADVVPIKASSE